MGKLFIWSCDINIGTKEFWCRGYYVDTAGKSKNRIAEYIKRQLDEDRAGEHLTMGNYSTRLRAAGSKTLVAVRPYLRGVTRSLAT